MQADGAVAQTSLGVTIDLVEASFSTTTETQAIKQMLQQLLLVVELFKVWILLMNRDLRR